LVPIPVFIALSEIVENVCFGSAWLTDSLLYRMAIVSSFLLAIVLSPRTKTGVAASLIAACVFLWATVIIHPLNPQIYDILYPFFLLGFIFALERARRIRTTNRVRVLGSISAGTLLSMAELSRPFVLYLLPVLLLMATISLRVVGRKAITYLLLPLLVISGSWHLYIGIAHGQLIWSNHSGFNIQRSWPDLPVAALIPEPNSAPLGPGHWPNLNTVEHQVNSGRLEAALFSYALDHPFDLVVGIAQRAWIFATGPTAIYGHQPTHLVLWLYRPLVWLSALALVFRLCRCALAARRYPVWIFEQPANQATLAAALTILVLAVGESGEQARFLLSVVPLLVVTAAAEADQLISDIRAINWR